MVDKTSIRLIKIIGIVFLLAWVALIVLNFLNVSGPHRNEVLDKLFGKHWFDFWIQPAIWIIMTQILHFEKIRTLKILRLGISLLFIGTIHQYTWLMTMSKIDFSNPWIQHITAERIITGVIVKIFLFLIVVAIFYLFETKYKALKSKKK